MVNRTEPNLTQQQNEERSCEKAALLSGRYIFCVNHVYVYIYVYSLALFFALIIIIFIIIIIIIIIIFSFIYRLPAFAVLVIGYCCCYYQ